MLNGGMKSEALSNLKDAQGRYENEARLVSSQSERLFKARMESSKGIVGDVEAYVNTLANTPKEFDRSFAEYKAEFKVFSDAIAQLEAEAGSVEFKAGSTAAAGVAIGVGTAAFAPTAAIAIATTFGTASTGTAISALSGAAATNAALAWLGGGAIAAGGGGMVSGSALLALAGPVGWTIGTAAIVGGGLLARSKNRKIAEQANEQRKAIELQIATLRSASQEITRLIEATERHVQGLRNLLALLKANAPNNYEAFSPGHKEMLGALINHIHSLSALLNKKVR